MPSKRARRVWTPRSALLYLLGRFEQPVRFPVGAVFLPPKLPFSSKTDQAQEKFRGDSPELDWSPRKMSSLRTKRKVGKKNYAQWRNAQVRWNRLTECSKAFQGVKIHLALAFTENNDVRASKRHLSKFLFLPVVGSGLTHVFTCLV